MVRRAVTTWGCVSMVTVFLAIASSVSAQDLPWDSFVDDVTGDVCDVVNAGPDKLVVLHDGSTFAIVSGPDRVLDDSFVDDNLDVFFDGLDPSLGGSIVYDSDALGNLGLWWVSATGNVMEIDDSTGELLITDLFPSDFLDSLCDACSDNNVCGLWDDLSACGVDPSFCDAAPIDQPDTTLPPDTTVVFPPVTVEICGSGIPISLGMIFSSLMVLRFSRRRVF